MNNTKTMLREHINGRQAFASLRYPNYRLWFFGQMVSLAGTWMQSTAQGYLVFEITKSPAYLGYVSLAAGIPTWLFMLYAGVIADRVPRRKLLITTQTTMMLLALVLASLTFRHWIQPWHILLLALLLAVANAFDAPARLAFVLEMVDREDLANAVALNATMFNIAVVVGPALSGLVYARYGPGGCFLINALSFLAVIVALLLMRLKPQTPVRHQRSTGGDLLTGLRYVAGQPLILSIITLVGIFSLFAISFSTLMPAWAVNVLHGDAATNGWLLAARGLGALLGALTIAFLGRFQFKGRLLTIGSLTFPITLLVFSQLRSLPLALAILTVVGFSHVLVMNLANTLVQTLAADDLRGRVMSIYALIFFGLMPIGGWLAGTVAERIQEPLTVAIGAGITLTSSLLIVFFVPRLRAAP